MFEGDSYFLRTSAHFVHPPPPPPPIQSHHYCFVAFAHENLRNGIERGHTFANLWDLCSFADIFFVFCWNLCSQKGVRCSRLGDFIFFEKAVFEW